MAGGCIRPRADFGELQLLKPCTHDLRHIDSLHAGLFACRHKVDPLDTCVRKNSLTCLCTSSPRCSTDRVTGKSNGFKVSCCTCHIESRFEKLMDVSGKPFIVHGIASPQQQQTTRNKHVSIHAVDLIMEIRRKKSAFGRTRPLGASSVVNHFCDRNVSSSATAPIIAHQHAVTSIPIHTSRPPLNAVFRSLHIHAAVCITFSVQIVYF